MTIRRAWFRAILPMTLGLMIGWGLGRAAYFADWPVALPERAHGLPAVDAGSAWGQHTPKPDEGQRLVAGPQVRANVSTDFNEDIEAPQIHEEAFLDPMSSVIGNVSIAEGVFLAPFASVRGDEGQPIHIGPESNLQDGVVVHALETSSHGKAIPQHTYRVHGKRYAVYVGNRVSLAHQSQVHGPAWIEDDVFVGMQALVFKAHIGEGTVIEPSATIIGVDVPAGRYVPAGAIVSTQEMADKLPEITYSYGLRHINKAVVHVNKSLAEGYAESLPASPER